MVSLPIFYFKDIDLFFLNVSSRETLNTPNLRVLLKERKKLSCNVSF